MTNEDFEELGYNRVQFVGGHADGQELWVERLNPRWYFAIAPDLTNYMRNLSKAQPTLIKRAVYVRIPGSTIYLFKCIEGEE